MPVTSAVNKTNLRKTSILDPVHRQNPTRKVLGNIENKPVSGKNATKQVNKLKPVVKQHNSVVTTKNDKSVSTSEKSSDLSVDATILVKLIDVSDLTDNGAQNNDKSVSSPRAIPDNVVDIDAESSKDLFKYGEYAERVYDYLRRQERSLRTDFMSRQTQVTPRMRSAAISWLVEIHYSLQLLPDTLYLAVDLVDRFLQIKNIPTNRLPLLAVTALLVASKYEEISPPSVRCLIQICDDIFSKREVLQMEIQLLKTLRFNVSRPLPVHFLRRYAQAAVCTYTTYTLAKYIMESSLLDHSMGDCSPSLLAAASFCFANLVTESEPGWTPILEFYSTYTLDQVNPIVKRLKDCLKSFQTCDSNCIHLKYASKNFAFVSELPELLACLKD